MLRKCFCQEEGGLLPHVNSGHCKLDSFQPQNHEEPLAEGAVAHVFAVMSSLKETRTQTEKGMWASEISEVIAGRLPVADKDNIALHA